MSIEATIYDRLSTYTNLTALVGEAIYPTMTTENAATLPRVVYTVTGHENNTFLSGPSSLNKYALSIDAYGIDKADVLAVLTQTKAALHDWREAPVLFSKCDTQSTMSTDPNAMGNQSFTVWATT